MVLNLADTVPIFLCGDHLIMVLQTDLFAQSFRPVDLVVLLAIVKTDRKGLLSFEMGGDVTGIYPPHR